MFILQTVTSFADQAHELHPMRIMSSNAASCEPVARLPYFFLTFFIRSIASLAVSRHAAAAAAASSPCVGVHSPCKGRNQNVS
jgi:hypothetical protein